MTDRYERIRAALADMDAAAEARNALAWRDAHARFVVHVAPDTIRELLAERDQLAAENARLREALRDAATSMQTIADKAGRDEWLMTTDEVRSYANSRANAARGALAVVRLVTVDGWQFCVLRDGDDQYVAARPLEPDHALGREWQPTDNLRTAHWRPSHLRTIAELLDPIQRAVDAENAAYRRATEAA